MICYHKRNFANESLRFPMVLLSSINIIICLYKVHIKSLEMYGMLRCDMKREEKAERIILPI